MRVLKIRIDTKELTEHLDSPTRLMGHRYLYNFIYLAAAAFFSFSLAITASATLVGQGA